MIWLSVILLNRSVFLQLAGVCIIVVRIQMEWRTRMSGGDMKFQFRRRPDAAIARPVTTLKRDLITNFMSVVDAEMKHFANKLFGNFLKFVQRRLGTEKTELRCFEQELFSQRSPGIGHRHMDWSRVPFKIHFLHSSFIWLKIQWNLIETIQISGTETFHSII